MASQMSVVMSSKTINFKSKPAATTAVKRDHGRSAASRVVRVQRASPIPRGLRHQAERVLATRYAFMDSQLFRRKGLEAELFTWETHEPALPMTSWYQPTREEVADVNTLGAPQLMSAKEEQLMFKRFNFAKYRLNQLQRKAKKEGLTRELAEQLVEWDRRFEHFREYLTRTNLALVLAMAKRTRLGDVDFAEIVSEGNMALIRSVDKFNFEKGFKFSTYACRAILKAFSRTSLKHSRQRSRFPVEFDPDMEKSDWIDKKRDVVEEDCIDELKQIVDRNLADLSDTEQTVLRRRFNWEQHEDQPLTLEEVGKIIGVTKERVRQIQNKALAKIRKLMEEGVLRTKSESPESEESETQASASLATLGVAEGAD